MISFRSSFGRSVHNRSCHIPVPSAYWSCSWRTMNRLVYERQDYVHPIHCTAWVSLLRLHYWPKTKCDRGTSSHLSEKQIYISQNLLCMAQAAKSDLPVVKKKKLFPSFLVCPQVIRLSGGIIGWNSMTWIIQEGRWDDQSGSFWFWML